jgi:hypothetical protein
MWPLKKYFNTTSNKEDSGIKANYGSCTSHKHKLTLDAPPFKLGLRHNLWYTRKISMTPHENDNFY